MLKCIIKAKDPRLHWISVAAPGFLITDPIPKDMLNTDPIPEGIPKVALPPQYTTGEAIFPHPAIIEEEEKEEVVEVSDFEDEFEVFNQPLSPEASTGDLGHPSPVQSSYNQEVASILDDMGIQCKQRSTLQKLLESQPRRDALGKAAQTKLPTLPPTQPLRHEPADLKKKKEQKGKGVVKGEQTHPS